MQQLEPREPKQRGPAVRLHVTAALRRRRRLLLAAFLLLLMLAIVLVQLVTPSSNPTAQAGSASTAAMDHDASFGHEGKRILVSYAYVEKDQMQRDNLNFFLLVGAGLHSVVPGPEATDFVIVISGDTCSPCQMVLPQMHPVPDADLPHGVKAAWTDQNLTLVHRKKNEGMDIGAHNVTIEWIARQPGGRAQYGAFIFLNSSTRGPFFPAYMPRGWQWTMAFTSLLSATVKVVGSSLVCLPPNDAGGVGPKVESWAYAVDLRGLNVLITAGVYEVYSDSKFGHNGIVVRGEYGISTFVLAAGYNIATLMSRYVQGIDWRDRTHWECNDQVHPSRLGTYNSITQHPYETMFVKSSWGTGEPFTSAYSKWRLEHAAGGAGTSGSFNAPLFDYAIQSTLPRSRAARSLPDALTRAQQCYNASVYLTWGPE